MPLLRKNVLLMLSLFVLGCGGEDVSESQSDDPESAEEPLGSGGASGAGTGGGSGSMTCTDGRVDCADKCVDTTADPDHCGACGVACANGSLCDASVCEELPDSRDIPGPGEPGFDPSVDPGVHPAFIDDPDLTRNEVYTYTPTEAGDHDLAEGLVAINYDVTGADDLRAVLTTHLEALQEGHGLALYLLNGTELNDADLDFLQRLNLVDDGLGLTNLDTLHVYNLRSLRGGIESTTVTAYGIPYPFLWSNGWQAPESELMKGDAGWVKHIVMDDLEEIKAGTFCDTMFESMSFKGVRVVREMGLGFGPRAPTTYVYMPSVVEVEQHAFRRRQRVLKYNFPRLTMAGPFAFDDNSQMQFFNAPSLINPPTDDLDETRNTVNDPRDLIAFNFPKVEYLGLSAMGGTNMTTTVFRFPALINLEGSSLRGHSNVRFVWLPVATRIGPNMFIGNAAMTDLYAPQVEWLGRFAFDECVSLTQLELPAVTEVQHSAFQGATQLEEVRLPNAAKLGDGAFLDLANLTSVTFGDTPPEQGSDVFAGTSTELVIYHSGDDPAWNDWSPAGNESAQVMGD